MILMNKQLTLHACYTEATFVHLAYPQILQRICHRHVFDISSLREIRVGISSYNEVLNDPPHNATHWLHQSQELRDYLKRSFCHSGVEPPVVWNNLLEGLLWPLFCTGLSDGKYTVNQLIKIFSVVNTDILPCINKILSLLCYHSRPA